MYKKYNTAGREIWAFDAERNEINLLCWIDNASMGHKRIKNKIIKWIKNKRNQM